MGATHTQTHTHTHTHTHSLCNTTVTENVSVNNSTTVEAGPALKTEEDCHKVIDKETCRGSVFGSQAAYLSVRMVACRLANCRHVSFIGSCLFFGVARTWAVTTTKLLRNYASPYRVKAPEARNKTSHHKLQRERGTLGSHRCPDRAPNDAQLARL